MKNTTKKILSMLLTVLMMLSVMPVAYAAEKSVRDIFIEEYARYFSYCDEGCYYVQGRPRVPNRPRIDPDEAAAAISINDEEKMLHYLDTLKEANAIVEEQIASGEVVIGIDGYYLVLLFIKLYKYNDDRLFMDFQERNPELTEEAWANFDKAGEILQNGGTQVEFDAYAYKWVDLYSLLIEHLDGNHDFNEYISNGDATEEADGTKTATCEFCGATDTVVDEGSKLVSEENCSCNCHKSGIFAFIWKILNFFYKIFGMNKTCVCGVAHY